MKKLLSLGVALALVLGLATYSTALDFVEEAVSAATLVNVNIPCEAAILMEPVSGKILFEKSADQQFSPASITKIMTMLLVMEAIEQGKITLDDMVTCSAHASSMGGSQIWFEPGEQMSVHELLKAVAVASANDAAVALGEHIASSEESFVQLMNSRAKELGMENTTFKNASGLDAEGHLSTARDIAIMSQELLKHENITQYTTIWMDTLRNGETELVNTNKLIRFMEGATGLKTGTTDNAGFCVSASAARGNLALIAVVLGAKDSDTRFGSARGLLEFGFTNYKAMEVPSPEPVLEPVAVTGGVKRQVGVTVIPPKSMLVEKGSDQNITQQQEILPEISAPVKAGDNLGMVRVLANGVIIAEYDIIAAEDVPIMTFGSALELIYDEIIKMK